MQTARRASGGKDRRASAKRKSPARAGLVGEETQGELNRKTDRLNRISEVATKSMQRQLITHKMQAQSAICPIMGSVYRVFTCKYGPQYANVFPLMLVE